MSIINIVSALGNNNSVYPLLVRDCGIENVAKCYLTYKQNVPVSKKVAKEATRERVIDEYGTSAVWLGGVPLISKLADGIIKKFKFAPEVNLKLFNETSAQGINLNINKFKDIAPDTVSDLIRVKNNKNAFQNLQLFKFFATTAIPITLMGFLLPKLNFLYTKNKNKKKKNSQISFQSLDEFKKSIKKTNTSKSISFKGLDTLANMSDLKKMMILDGGLTIGRVKTGRNWEEKAELGFKMILMCYLNYIAPKNLEKGLNKLTKKLFKVNTSLDIKTLNDKDFMQNVKENTLKLPLDNSEKTIIDFIDSNPFSPFAKQAEKLDLVSFVKKGVRDPRKFLETDKIVDFKSALEEFSSDAIKSGNFENFRKQAVAAKCFNTLANVAISSFLLAGVLPKIQFWFREKVTNSKLDPGVKKYADD